MCSIFTVSSKKSSSTSSIKYAVSIQQNVPTYRTHIVRFRIFAPSLPMRTYLMDGPLVREIHYGTGTSER